MEEFLFKEEFFNQTQHYLEKASYIHKGYTGCGITSYCLENEESVIVLTPSITLVKDKSRQYPNERCDYEVLGVYGDTSTNEIDKYFRTHYVHKVISTYDSLWKLQNYLCKCRIIVDESGDMFNSVELKQNKGKNVICYLLDALEPYKDNITFVSATPIPVEYLPKWVQDLRQIKYTWTNTIKSKPILLKRSTPYNSLLTEILLPIKKEGSVNLGGRTFKKCLIFMNTVKKAVEIAQNAGLDEDEVGFICSETVENYSSLKDYQIIEDYTDLPQYTFITKTGFSGIDIYDEECMTIVVSSTSRDWRVIDLYSELEQCIGRQRNKLNPNYNRYIFIYDERVMSTEYLLSTLDDMKIQYTDNINTYNKSEGTEKDNLIKTLTESRGFATYCVNIGDSWKLNELLLKSKEYRIKEVLQRYSDGVILMDSEIIVIDKPQTNYQDGCAYTTIYGIYQNSLTDSTVSFTDLQLKSEAYQLIDAYYKRFGTLEKNSYKAKIRLQSRNDFEELENIIKTTFTVGNIYTNDYIKSTLQKIYKKYSLRKNAKATDINEFFETTRTNKNTKRAFKINAVKE